MSVWLSVLLVYLAGGTLYLLVNVIYNSISKGKLTLDLSVDFVPAYLVLMLGLFGYPFFIYTMTKDWLGIHWKWLRRRKNKN